MTGTRHLAARNEYVRSRDDEQEYSAYQMLNPILHEVRQSACEKKFELFKRDRPKAAAFLEAVFTDNAAEVALYFPPDISELRCGQMLAALNPGNESGDSRAKNALDSHIDDL